MFVNVSTVVAALVMIVVPFVHEVKGIVTELGKDKSKVQQNSFTEMGKLFLKLIPGQFSRNWKFFLQTHSRWMISPAILLFSNIKMTWEQNLENLVRMINSHQYSCVLDYFDLLPVKVLIL